MTNSEGEPMKHTGAPGIDIYPVGLLADLKQFRARWWTQGRRAALRRLRREFTRSWRQRSYWNGYLAEPNRWPDGLHRCGSGWTPTRARLSLARLVARTQPTQTEPLGLAGWCTHGIGMLDQCDDCCPPASHSLT